MKDLFGKDIGDDVKPKLKSPYQSFKVLNQYRKSGSKDIKCKHCRFLVLNDGYSKRYYKCRLIGLSCGPATDIRVGYVCNRFEVNNEEGE